MTSHIFAFTVGKKKNNLKICKKYFVLLLIFILIYGHQIKIYGHIFNFSIRHILSEILYF